MKGSKGHELFESNEIGFYISLEYNILEKNLGYSKKVVFLQNNFLDINRKPKMFVT